MIRVKSKIDLTKYDVDCPFMGASATVRISKVACFNMGDDDIKHAQYVCNGSGLCGSNKYNH